ncbi:DegT/DnrJ/EryC1/StrS family aminotransferase [bacterium]|nr:MAG: DegT/DnrJ/EryC1/StrS family aminotransferase [bacterium]
MIPVCEPFLSGKELEYVTDCLKTNWISSQGKYIEQFEQRFAAYCGCEYGISTTSGTTALHLALASLGIGPGDEVIVPAFTMISTAFAIIYTGAKPVLVDAEPETWNIDVTKIEQKVTRRTKAILPVHIYGHPCDMEPIMNIAQKYSLHVIEDAAEAHGAEYKGRKAGGIGHIGCFSFYANKIITTGEGGMVVTNDETIAEKARALKDLAFSRQMRFLHTDLGFNYRMTNIQAAIGLAQFEKIEQYVEMRRKNAYLYNHLLKHIPSVTLPPEKEWAKNVYWMYSILIDDKFGISRDELMDQLRKEGIDTRTFFIPIHQQPVFENMRLFNRESYPVAEDLGRRGLYLPSSSGLTEKQIKQVCQAISKIRGER